MLVQSVECGIKSLMQMIIFGNIALKKMDFKLTEEDTEKPDLDEDEPTAFT